MSRLDQQAARDLQRADPHDEALAAEYGDERVTELASDATDQGDCVPSIAERFRAQMTGFSDDEFQAAEQPHPHAFQADECGLFPVGEVSVIAAPGREGKTFATVSIGVSYCLGTNIAGLAPQPDRSVVIYSAEDDRPQYARKVLAHVRRLGRRDASAVQSRILVPDLTAPGMECFLSLVTVAERQPITTPAVAAIIEALRPMMAGPHPPGLLIFETASTLSDADEDNRSFRAMIKALRAIARALGVAVVLVHHTSQQAATNLPELNLSVADIRGATALAYNARQCFLLVNLGSAEDPFADADARAVLRSMVAGERPGRITVLVCLDSSKAVDPPPIFFEWDITPCGPALRILALPRQLQGVRWRRLQQMLRTARTERREDAKEEARMAGVRDVVAIATDFARRGKAATASAVSAAAGKSSPTWAKPRLEQAVALGELRRSMEPVPQTKGLTAVYRPVDGAPDSARNEK